VGPPGLGFDPPVARSAGVRGARQTDWVIPALGVPGPAGRSGVAAVLTALGVFPTAAAAVAPLLRPYPADAMRAYPVGQLVNNARNDGPGCLTAAV
jgi:hypothetical protein